MRIIKCTTKHLNSVSAFYDKVTEYLEKQINYPKWTQGNYPGTESTRQAIADDVQYACMDGDKVVGAFILNDNPQGDYNVGDWRVNLSQGEYLVIHTLATDPEIYRKGLGRYMVEYCIHTAKENGYKAVRLDVIPTNAPARRLYENMGFLFAGEKDLSRDIKDISTFALYELNFL